jgi:hypothetical protein
MKLQGHLHVPLPPDDAIALFTAEGERAWVPGWDPRQYDDAVFTTHDDQTFWVTVDQEPRRRRYARVTPGVHAGTVEVRCEPDGAHTRAHVTYELTALEPDALSGFADGYEGMLAEWERLIDGCLSSR